MDKKLNFIEKKLKSLFPKTKCTHSILFEAANYALLGKAKRLRPMFVLLITQILKKDYKKAIYPALALELVHTYSLIHDDLPCMDDDDFRRGKLSLHKKYSEWTAVLTGDFLLTYSFELLTKDKKFTSLQKEKLVTNLCKYCGNHGLLAGQCFDLFSENKKLNLKQLYFMHINKTASLFMAAAHFAAIICNASKELSCKLVKCFKNFGIAFQIANDIKGYYKKSSDIIKKKSTVATLFGLEKAKLEKEKFLKKTINCLKKLSYDSKDLQKYIIAILK